VNEALAGLIGVVLTALIAVSATLWNGRRGGPDATARLVDATSELTLATLERLESEVEALNATVEQLKERVRYLEDQNDRYRDTFGPLPPTG